MKIINIDDFSNDLSIDNTFISIDNDVITIDQTVYDSGCYEIKLIPRILPNEGEILRVNLRNELTGDIQVVDNYFNYHDNYFNLYLTNVDLSFEGKYVIDIILNDVIIYKGKLFVTNKNREDIQDYQVTKKINNKLKWR